MNRAAELLARSLFLAAGGSVKHVESQMPQVNQTLAENLMVCLTESWDCSLFDEFLSWEQKSLRRWNSAIQLDHWGPFIDSRRPANYYVGTYSIQNGGGQPTVVHGSVGALTRYVELYS